MLVAAGCVASFTARAQKTGVDRGSLSAFDSAKVQGLLRTRLACRGCHVVGDSGGRIGPDLTHVASRRSVEFIRAIVTDPARAVPGTLMPRAAMPAPMRELLIRYLAANAVSREVPARVARQVEVPGAPLTGAALYARHCAACHGDRGTGDGANARFLPVRPAAHADATQMSTRSDDRLFDAVFGGGYPLGRSALMPAFGETLTRDEIWLLVGHMRTLCGCAGPAWSRRGVTPATMAPARSP